MVYLPLFVITPAPLAEVEQVGVLHERIQNTVMDLAWIPALQNNL